MTNELDTKTITTNLSNTTSTSNSTNTSGVVSNTSSNIPKVPVIKGNVPGIPKIPNIPNIPKIPEIKQIPNIENLEIKNIEKEQTENKLLSREDELNALKSVLKKAESTTDDPTDTHSLMKKAICRGVILAHAPTKEKTKITLNDRNCISATLSMALEQRRKDMGKDKIEEASDSDWSD